MSSIGGNFPNNGNSNIGSANRANKRPFNDPENKHDDTEVDNKYDGEDDGEHKDWYDNEQKGVESNKRQRTEEAKPSELFPPNDVAPVVTELSEQEVVHQACDVVMEQLINLIGVINEKMSSSQVNESDLTGMVAELVTILSSNEIPDAFKPSFAKIVVKLVKFFNTDALKVINEKLFNNCSIKLFTEYVKLGITKSKLFQIMPFIPDDKKIIQQWILVASHSDYIPFLAKICEAIAKAYGFRLNTSKDQIVQLIQLENASNLDPEGARRKFLILLLPLLIKRSPEILINKDVFELLNKYAKEPAVKAYLPLWSIPGGLPHPAFNMIFTCEPVSLYRLIEQKIITVNSDGKEFTTEESLRDLVNAALSMISKLPAFKIQGLSREVLDNLGLYANLYKMTSSSSMEAFKSDYLSVFADKLMEISRGLTTDDARKDFFYKFNGLINAVMAGLSILSNQGGLTELCKGFREIYNQCAETILAGGVVTVNPYYNNHVDEYYESDIFDAKNNLKLSGHLLFTAKEGGLVLMPLGYYLKYVCAAIDMDKKDQYYSYSRIKIISRVDEGWQQTDMHDFNLTKFFKEKFSLFWPYYYPALHNSIAGTFRAIFPEELAERCELLCHSDGTNYKGFVEINFETGEIGSEKLFNLLNNVITYNEIPP